MKTQSYLQNIAQRCEAMGSRFTPLRRTVMQLILEHNGPIKAYDILALLQQKNESAAPPTVYRTLDFLVENGFVHKVEALNAFIACSHMHEHEADILLICRQCSRVIEFDEHSLQKMLVEATAAAGFKMDIQKIELKGLCAACALSS
jgi:Fur family zinc uptake transcriptional regulator